MIIIAQQKFPGLYKGSYGWVFFPVNDNGAVSDSVLWESFKAIVRGKIIANEASKKKHNCLVGMEIQLSETDKAYISSLSMKKLYCIVTLKNEDNTILIDQFSR